MIFKRQQTDKKEIKSSSIYMRIQQPLIILAVLNAFLLLLIVSVMRVPYQLNKNSYDLCQKQVDNRQRYLQSQMTDNWMQIHSLADVVNRTADRMIREEELDFEMLDSSTAECTPLILEVVDDLIRELYFRKVSGIYLTFNTHDLNAEATSGNYKEKTGIYIRDKDPLSASSEKYADLLLECSPAKVVQTLSLSTDRDWEQKMKFSKENPYEDWFTEPYLMARAYEDMDASDCGLWSIKRTPDGKSALTYSIPLILSDGRVYGVLGVEILNSYLEVLLPHSELDEKAFYGLLVSDQAEQREDIDGRLYSVTTKNSPFELWEELSLSPTEYDGLALYDDAKRYEVALAPLSIYSRNTPFDNQKWYVLGAVPTGKLFAFSNRVRIMLIVSSLIIFLFGIMGALAASQHISKPIRDVQQEVLDAGSNIIPELS
ncbi:MAG: hypothetical protein KBT01_01425, partial [Clostridiales bacterium]|nr:hypothetical protein [Candidatus Blautia equi]